MAKGSKNIAVELIKGAIAGAVSVWAMDRVTWYMYRNEDRKAFIKEKKAQVNGHYAAHVAVDKVAKATGTELTNKQHWYAGKGVHYFLGVAPAMVYSVMRHKVNNLDAGRGAVFGLGLFLLMDELVAPAAGFASGPTAYPWQAHVRGLAGHLTVGIVTDGVLRALDESLPA